MWIPQNTPDRSRRRGIVLLEVAIVLPILFLFLIGTITIGMGVFRYQQVAALAREEARYASVHGAQYAQDTGNTAATYTDIYNNAILPYAAAGLKTANIVFTSSSVSWPNGKWPTRASSAAATSTIPAGTPVVNTVSVTVAYTWTPEKYIVGPITLSSTSVMPMSY